jgi:hypothetical protein
MRRAHMLVKHTAASGLVPRACGREACVVVGLRTRGRAPFERLAEDRYSETPGMARVSAPNRAHTTVYSR